MTSPDLTPFIVQDHGDGTGTGRRIRDEEFVEFAQRLLDWLPENSVLVRGGGGSPTGAIRITPGQSLGRLGGDSIASLGPADMRTLLELPALFDAKAALGHDHLFAQAIADIDWSTLQDGRILAREGGEFVWIPTPAGGGSGGTTSDLTNPLGEDLDLGGQAIMDGALEVLKVQDGKLYILQKEVFTFDVAGATDGQVPRYSTESGQHENANPRVSDLVGITPGKFLAVAEDGHVNEVDGPSGTSDAFVYDGTNYFLPNLPTADPNVVNALWDDGKAIVRSTGPAAGAAWSASPGDAYEMQGSEGNQDFSPSSREYTLTNDGTTTINWTAQIEASWASVSPASGSLSPSSSVTVTVAAIQSELDDLPEGTTIGGLRFSGPGVPDIDRGLQVLVSSTSSTANRSAVFADDPTKYGQASWAPTTQDYTVRFRAKFTGTDDSPVFGGDIYGDLGLIKKGSGQLQFWINSAGLSTANLTIVNDTYYTFELAKVGSTVSVTQDGVATDTLSTSNSVPTSAFVVRIGALISGNANGMEGSLDFLELIDPADSTNTALFDFANDDFANSSPSSTVPNGTNVGGVTFEDA